MINFVSGYKAQLHSLKYLVPFIFLMTFSSCKQKPLFTLVKPDYSGVHFNNKITETDSVNVLDFSNIYNGGGVGVADFNNDGLQDIYFTGNMVPNKLYLNKGNLQFDDVTNSAGVTGDGRWCRGVSIIDINNDGLQDMYVCTTIKNNAAERQNLLYINQGFGKDKKVIFKEVAADYGLNDTSYATMASFFDYDNDGDLDIYIVANQIIDNDYPNKFRPRNVNLEHPSTGRLYRNDWNTSKGHPYFTNVSKLAGITIEGYGHSAVVTDINKDGWKDILVSNDYISQDILYINNRNGTFTDKIESFLKHTSANAMGSDVADINNDGLQDIVELDMNPEDNYRKKMMLNANSYQTYQNSDYFNIQYQYVRNTLQLNLGPNVKGNDTIGDPVFGDIGYMAGIAETDWSWTPMVVDFDNNGFRDILITNGFPKDVTDHDFIAFRNMAYSLATKKQMLEQIPKVKIHNYSFKNNGNLQFINSTLEWGFTTPSFSNGAAYADLDNDGDLDVIVNNIDDKAFIYENNLREKDNQETNFISVKLIGDSLNRNGFGVWIELYYDGKQQVYEQNPYRGYLSTIQMESHFGLGKINTIDSMIVKWPNGKKQKLLNVKSNHEIIADIRNADQLYSWTLPVTNNGVLFTDITDTMHVSYVHQQEDFIDFNIQKLLPHKFSEFGPALATGDVNGDGLDDLVIGGNATRPATLLFQTKLGKFEERLLDTTHQSVATLMDMGVTVFDIDNDNDLDIYIARGGYEVTDSSTSYADQLYLNNGHGTFINKSRDLPKNYTSKSCVRPCDFDGDGDLDLFIAGRVAPGKYPLPVSSILLRNDCKNGVIKFTDITEQSGSPLKNIGLVCDAVWSDYDGDGWMDLILTGEWMPVKFLKNNRGVLQETNAVGNFAKQLGWWTSIVPGDFDNDGDIDYVAGNLGLNSFYKASTKYPVRIYAKDFDTNGSFDAVPTMYLASSQSESQLNEYPVHTRDDMTKQMISFKSKFQKYSLFASATFNKMFTANELKGALVLEANNFTNSYFKNAGGGKFEISPLPIMAQLSCLNGMVAEDFDADGNLDLLAVGNDYSTEVSVGRYDAGVGIFLKGDGNGNFTPGSILKSGWFVPGNGKALVKFNNSSGQLCLAASQNKGPLKVFIVNKPVKTIALNPHDVGARIFFKNGKIRSVNVDYGSSFLSQSARTITVNDQVSYVEITDKKGNKRKVN